MSDTNFVILIGRLVRDADLRYTTSGTAITKFSIAVNKKTKVGSEMKDVPSYFEIILWGKLGESLHKYLTKGKQISVTGELNQERWQQQDGDNRSKVNVVAHTVQLLGSSTSGYGVGSGQKQGNYSSATDEDFIDDIPF